MSIIQKSRISGLLSEQIDDITLKDVHKLYEKIKDGDEFEFMFFNYKRNNRMGLENFLRIIDYLKFRNQRDKLELINLVTLDINYVKTTGESYRITINGINDINKYIKMLHNRKNHVIFSVLVGLAEKDKNITLLKKTKDKENVIDIDDFDIRVRLATEENLNKNDTNQLKNLDETERNNITFRYKQRMSLMLINDTKTRLSIDLTNVKTSKNINRLEQYASVYELEIDLSTFKGPNPKKNLDIMLQEANSILQILQQSNYIMSNSLQDEILNFYRTLTGVEKENLTTLAGRKPQSLEIQHVIDKLPNKYAVTDKADGERNFLIIYGNAVFLITDLLQVKNTGITLKENLSKYNNTIIDGELIFHQSQNRYILMCFDCLFNGGKDVRQESRLMTRLQNIDEIIENCFVDKNQTGYKILPYTGEYNSNKIIEFHQKQITNYMNSLNNDIKINKQYPLIRRKYFIDVVGAQNNEIFKYAKLMWNKYVHDEHTKTPYILDGLIFHPLDQKYITSVKDSKFLDYKWKPNDKNSLDFYVLYERSRDTGKIVTLYDNSRDIEDLEENEQIRGKPYRILKLYVGKLIKGVEEPILFEPEKDSVKHLAYIYLKDGEVRDEQDNIIQDGTVVEFYYNTDSNVQDKYRWVPMRTRYDKTESVRRFGKKYGNYTDIANKVWRSIRNPFTMDDINILSNDNTYNKHLDILSGRIDHSIILSERNENIYYQIRTTLGKPMRNFHNWIKSILIYTYVNSMYEKNGKQLSALDIACGRGGDIMRFYYGKVNFYVGIDVDNNGLTSPQDGAISRYNQLRKTHPNFPQMFFIQADAGVLLNYEDQYKALGGISSKNADLMKRFFSSDDSKRTKFDRHSCQFAIHYFFENSIIFNNFAQNINDYMKDGGYLIVTTFDADRIIQLLDGKDQFTSYYTNTNGEQKVLFEIIKKYDNIKPGDDIGLGVAIDFHNALDFQEGVYVTEYLVQKQFIEKQFLEKCNMELVDTDLFENQYIMHKDFFLNAYKYEENEKTRKFLKDAAEYYTEKSEINTSSFQLTRLYRHYVFRKKDNLTKKNDNTKNNNIVQSKKTSKKNIKQKGGFIINDVPFNDATDLFDPTKFIKREIIGVDNYTFLSSVHDILATHQIIPRTVSFMELCNDIGLVPFIDNKLTHKKVNKFNKNLVIKHDYTESDISSEIALNGVNILVIKKDCQYSDVEIYGCGNNSSFAKLAPAVLLFFDNDKYYPIYKIKNDNLIGMFDNTDSFIQNIIKN